MRVTELQKFLDDIPPNFEVVLVDLQDDIGATHHVDRVSLEVFKDINNRDVKIGAVGIFFNKE